MSSSTLSFSGKSDLLPSKSKGIPSRTGFCSSECNSSFATGRASLSAESTINLLYGKSSQILQTISDLKGQT